MFQVTEQPSSEERIASREAHLLSLEVGPDAALRLLGGKSDPESVAGHLQILIEHDRFKDAQNFLNGREPHVRWSHLAAYALARCGDTDGAERVISPTKRLEDRLIQQRATFTFAQGSIECIVARSGRDGSVVSGMLTQTDRALLQRVVSALQGAFAFDQLQNPLEQYACSVALQAQLLLNEKHAAERLAKLLETCSPIPLVLADAVLSNDIPAPTNLPERLRSEHPQSFDAKLKAALIEGGILGRPGPALAAAMDLKEMAVSRTERSSLLRAIAALGQLSGHEAQGLVDGIVPDLIDPEDSEGKLFRAESYLQAGNLDAAEALLEGVKDEANPSWLRAAAALRERRGDVDKALELLLKAAAEYPHQTLLRQAAAFAYNRGRLNAAADLLEKLAVADPNDLSSRRNLAVVYGRMGDFARAVTHFRAVHERDPKDPDHALRLAVSLSLADRSAESLAVYEDLCSRPAAPLEAHLGRATVLIALGHTTQACHALEGVREQFWDQPVFLMAVMRAGYAADREALASEALKHLAELEEAKDGGAGIRLLQPKTLDELKAYIFEQREFNEGLQRQVLRGRLPWQVMSQHFGGSLYRDWAHRTQRMEWVPEDPLVWAEYNLYATNGFTVSKRVAEGRSVLVPMSAGDHMRIVADLTALITLHRLGLLGHLRDRFQEILVPSVYSSRVLDERVGLRPHQLSRRNASILLSLAVEQGRLRIWDQQKEAGETPPVTIQEYGLDADSGDSYRLIDLGAPLYQGGMLGEAEYTRFRALSHRSSATTAGKTPLSLGDRVLCRLHELETIASAGALDSVLEGFATYITPMERERLRCGENAHNFQAQVAAWHTDLWQQLSDQTRFVRVAPEIPRQWQQETEEWQHREAALEAALIAMQHKVPLLADDRVCQMLVLNQEGSVPTAAFGTDQFIAGLLAESRLTVQMAAQALLQLMRWRYRFFVPPVAVLVECAHRYRQHPPGRDLQDVARYAHDCMRDPGLFNGPESTEPPIPMGFRLAESWAAVAGDFIVQVWADERFSEPSAKELTRWAVEQLLPSPPLTLPPHWQRMLAMLAPTSVLSGALTQCLAYKPSTRTRQAFEELRQVLGLSEERFRRAVTEVISGF